MSVIEYDLEVGRICFQVSDAEELGNILDSFSGYTCFVEYSKAMKILSLECADSEYVEDFKNIIKKYI